MIKLRDVFILGLAVAVAACSSEPSYVPAAERVESGDEEGSGGDEGKDDEAGNDVDEEGNGGKNDEDGSQDGGIVVNGHRGMDLGLSVCWAAANLDASRPDEDSEPLTPGSLFKWGATRAVTSSEAPESFPSVPDDSDISGTAYDAATALWKAPWRMPTAAEFNELVGKCEISWEGSGYRLTAPGGESIFLPAAGYCDFLPYDPAVYDFQYPAEKGYYRVSGNSQCMVFEKPEVGQSRSPFMTVVPGYAACSIRPVCELPD
ncbi:MAG: hypothetical protein K2G84_07280 [Muribaculaceae bacterium]|nr:hypothetical protein [Muribaculaceae bacterium]